MPFDPDISMTWVGFTASDTLCPDCKKLVGQTRTWGEWMASGITPGSGMTICKDYCRCLLVEAAQAIKFGIEHIKIGDLDIAKLLFPAEVDLIITKEEDLQAKIRQLLKYPDEENI